MKLPVQIRLPRLNRLEQLELESLMPQDAMSVEHDALEGAEHGEPFTITAIVLLSGPALAALTAWLLKNRRSQVVEQTVVRVKPDGSTELIHLRVDTSLSEAPSGAVIKQLSESLRLDPELAADALRRLGGG